MLQFIQRDVSYVIIYSIQLTYGCYEPMQLLWHCILCFDWTLYTMIDASDRNQSFDIMNLMSSFERCLHICSTHHWTNALKQMVFDAIYKWYLMRSTIVFDAMCIDICCALQLCLVRCAMTFKCSVQCYLMQCTNAILMLHIGMRCLVHKCLDAFDRN